MGFLNNEKKNAELIEESSMLFTKEGKKVYLKRLIEIFRNNKFESSQEFSYALNRNLQYIVYAFNSNQLNTSFKFNESHNKQISDFFLAFNELVVEWTKLVEK